MLKQRQSSVNAAPVQTFRVSALNLYAAMAFWTALLAVPLHLAFIGGAPHVFELSLLFVGLLFEFGCALLITACFPVRLSADGIQGQNFWGFSCAMTWDEIASVRPSRAYGLPWLIVRSHQSRNALWLPLFLADPKLFRDTVSRLAPPSSPLR
ncbi:MAG: hypothetical protein V4671_18630 [Armatimonadota bacterium]